MKRKTHIFILLAIFLAMMVIGYFLRDYDIGFIIFLFGIVLTFVTLFVIGSFHFSIPCPFCGYPVSTLPFSDNTVNFLPCPSCLRLVPNPYKEQRGKKDASPTPSDEPEDS